VNQNKPGSYTLVYSAADSLGNVSVKELRTVNVVDTTGPVITLKGGAVVTHEAGSSYTDAGASAEDAVDGDLSREVEVVSTVDVGKPGTYTVSYGVSDRAGNKAKPVVRAVEVVDRTGPVITLSGSATVTHEAGSSYTDAGASATDVVDGDLSGEVEVLDDNNPPVVSELSDREVINLWPEETLGIFSAFDRDPGDEVVLTIESSNHNVTRVPVKGAEYAQRLFWPEVYYLSITQLGHHRRVVVVQDLHLSTQISIHHIGRTRPCIRVTTPRLMCHGRTSTQRDHRARPVHNLNRPHHRLGLVPRSITDSITHRVSPRFAHVHRAHYLHLST
jgi:hypothetical protein